MSRCDDYCCNQGCNQGRDCPARVARVSKRTQDRDPLPPSAWRNKHLKHLAKAMLLTVAVMTTAAIGLAMIF